MEAKRQNLSRFRSNNKARQKTAIRGFLFRFPLLALFVIFTLGAALPPRTQSANPSYALVGGYFFAETNGQGGVGETGFSVTDAGGIALWSQFSALGGTGTLGYPVSHRFIWNGSVVQAFQKGVLQWQPANNAVTAINIFDEMTAAGKDDWLSNVRLVPHTADWSNDQGKSPDEVIQNHLSLLDQNPAIKQAYYSGPDPLMMNGLPMSIQDFGNVFVMRAQRTVFQQWKVDTPWARAGEVSVANGGDIAKDAGLFPVEAIQPAPPDQPALDPRAVLPGNGTRTVLVDAGHGGDEVGAAYVFPDGFLLREKDVNLKVALRLAALLREAGYRVVTTRETDASVNAAGADVDGTGEVNVADDLQARTDLANAVEADVLVSIHQNGFDNPNLSGTIVYYDPDRPFSNQNLRLAQIIQTSVVSSIRTSGYDVVDRGINTDTNVLQGEHFHLLGPVIEDIVRASQMPGIVGEALFVTNPEDASQLRSESTIEAIARGYAVGISQYLATDK